MYLGAIVESVDTEHSERKVTENLEKNNGNPEQPHPW